MKEGFSTVRRAAAAVGISLSMLVAAGTGAGAAETPKVSLTNYTASAMSQTLRVSLKLPSAVSTLNGVVQNLGLGNVDLSNIDERISFASALGQWQKDAVTGEAQAQVFTGSLNGLLSKVLGVEQVRLDTPTKVRTTKANDVKVNRPAALKELNVADFIKVGIGKSAATTATAVNSAVSNGASSVASIDVTLDPLLGNAGLKQDLGLLTDQLNGVIDNINATLSGVLANAGIAADPVVPSVGDLTKANILHIGIMDAKAGTGVQKLSKALADGATEFRTAHASNTLADVDILNGLVHVDAIQMTADAKLDNRAHNASATPVTRILGLKVGKNQILDLTTGKINIAGQKIDMTPQLKSLLDNLVVNIAGVNIEALRNVRDVRDGHAFAQANSLKISVAPAIQDPTSKTARPLFALAVQGPMAQAGVDLNTTQVLGFNTRTGLNDTMFMIVGPLMFGAALIVRRFALSR